MVIRTEQQLLDAVIDLAKLNGWMVTHFRPARTEQGWRTALQGDKGWPDVMLARRGVLLLRELKRDTEHLAQAQTEWAEALSGETWQGRTTARLSDRTWTLFDVWRPSDFDRLIVPTLTARVTAGTHR